MRREEDEGGDEEERVQEDEIGEDGEGQEEPQLQRSKTEVGRKAEREEDAEEFRRTIEELITKQRKFNLEESMVFVSTTNE